MLRLNGILARLFPLAAALSVLLLLMAACGGDDDDDGGSDEEATATKTADSGEDEPEETDEAEETEDSGDDGDDGDSLSALRALTEDYETFTGKVTYTVTEFADGGGLTAMVIYQKEGKSRIDIESADGNVTVISTTDASYLCSEGQCIKYPAGDETTTAGIEAFTSFLSAESIAEDFDIPEGVDVDESSEEIAGIDAICYSASGDLDEEEPGDESGTVCFSESGLLLRITFEGGSGSGSFEATEASTDVSDSDFEPPFDVIEIPDIGQ